MSGHSFMARPAHRVKGVAQQGENSEEKSGDGHALGQGMGAADARLGAMTGQSRITLEGKTVLITGASRGIGAAMARACAEAGARVVVTARKQEGLDQVAAEIGGAAVAIACHMGKAEQVKGLFAQAVEAVGPIDALVNNAATNPYFGPMIGIGEDAFDKTFEVNVKGYWHASRELVAHLRATGRGGSIVNIASVAGMESAPLQGVYGMTKAAILSMTRTLAAELGSSGVRVNAIAPGLIETRFSSALVGNPVVRDLVVKRTPLGRHGQPVEIAAAAVYLLSDAASFVTGHTMVIDGGYTA
jgi:NAD(P)-dependent dehydrogenase (short-subunit alcohol dehydrogenase family)